MATVAIVYFSGFGNTALMAEAVAAGAREAGSTVEMHRIDGATQIKDGRWNDPSLFEKLAKADAIIFGSPTYMGNVAAQFKAFADATGMIWMQRGWADKVAGGFTHSGGLSGDKLFTLQYLALFAGQHGMHWVSTNDIGSAPGVNRLGSYLGPMGQTKPSFGQAPPSLDEGDRATAHAYGKRVASFTNALKK
jgi:NAD(P)H dehydrogenase (quinone)